MRRALSFAAAQFLNPLCAFISGPIVARSLGVEDRGLLAAATTAVIIATFLGSTGIPQAAGTEAAKSEAAGLTGIMLTAFRVRMLAGTAFATVVTTVVLSSTLTADTSTITSYACVAVPPLIFIECLRGIAIGQGRTNIVQFELAIANVGRLGAIVILSLLDQLDLLAALMATWGLAVVAAAPYLVASRRERQRVSAPSVPIRPDHRAANSFWLAGLSAQLKYRLDQILLLPLAGAAALGTYAVAVSLSQLLSLGLYGVAQAMFRATVKDKSGALATMVVRVTLPCALLLITIAQITAEPAIRILFGEDFSPAVEPFRILVFAALPLAISGLLTPSLAGAGRTRRVAAGEVTGLVIGVVTLLMLASGLGGIGAALASLVSYVSTMVVILASHRSEYQRPLSDYLLLKKSDIQMLARKARRVH